jgi:virginiamycin B lyase
MHSPAPENAMRRLPAACAALVLSLCALAAARSEATEIREWPVPWADTRPRDPSVAPDGRVWFVGQGGNYLAVFDAGDGSFRRFELPAGTRPHTVLVDAQGRPWVAGNGNGTILRYAADGRLQQTFTVPADGLAARPDPHTFAFDGAGGLWFTMQQANAIGHLDTAAGTIRIARVATAQARPYGIVATPDGDAWAVLFGVGKLARVARADMALAETALPRPLARPRRLGLDGEGRVWYVDFAQGLLGRHDPRAGTTQEWPAPSSPSAPYAMAMDGRGRPWFFESAPQPNLLQGFEPNAETWLTAAPVPGGGGTVRHMEYDRSRNSFWFGTDRNTLGQAILD